MLTKKQQKLWQELKIFIRYSLVGIIGTVIDLTILYLLVENFAFFDRYQFLAYNISFLAAATNNFILNKFWTFQNRSRNYRKQFIKFLLVSIGGLLLTNILMPGFQYLFGVWYLLAKALTSVIVMIWNFLANKLWTFRPISTKAVIIKNCPFSLSIIIPAYNEEGRILATLKSIKDYLKKEQIKAEVIVVSDGSQDQTATLVQKMAKDWPNLKLIDLPTNYGKGYAVRHGIKVAQGERILFTDADNSTPISEYTKLKKYLSKAEVVIGSRHLETSKIKIAQSRYRQIISRIGNRIIEFFLIDNIKDTQCGFKLFSHKAAKDIFARQKILGFGFDMEILVIAQNLNYKIKEVPVNWYNSADSRFRPIKDTFRTFAELIIIKLNLWAGRYSD
jgi:dolichyl-phosphate beta-glucosyltransferase